MCVSECVLCEKEYANTNLGHRTHFNGISHALSSQFCEWNFCPIGWKCRRFSLPWNEMLRILSVLFYKRHYFCVSLTMSTLPAVVANSSFWKHLRDKREKLCFIKCIQGLKYQRTTIKTQKKRGSEHGISSRKKGAYIRKQWERDLQRLKMTCTESVAHNFSFSFFRLGTWFSFTEAKIYADLLLTVIR